MLIKKINILFLLMVFLIFIICKNTNFFANLHHIANKSHDNRQQKANDFCNHFGSGYVFYIKEKFKLKNSPIIKNYKKTPEQYWIFSKSYKSFDENKLIILNKNKSTKVNLNEYKILDDYNNRCLFMVKK
tara:strand:+ start:62 stop:451 length:390 start_codon:yes stop_codon:yes gene_type:complete